MYLISLFNDLKTTMKKQIPAPRLAAIKQTAARAFIPYQRFIRHALEAAIQSCNETT